MIGETRLILFVKSYHTKIHGKAIMRTESTRCSSLWTVIFIFLLLPLGCATLTKPNIPYSGPIPELGNIELRNPLLAREIRKLPEFLDGVSPLESSALENIVELYDRFPDKFDKAFEKMNDVGLPDVRKYCSPLQAIYWLAEDGKDKDLVSVLHKYSLENLLKSVWGGGYLLYERVILSDKDLDIVINSVTDESERNRYKKMKQLTTLSKIRNYLIIDYKKMPELFSEKGQAIIRRTLDNPNWRWKDFDVVVDRLNDPELIQYWINMNIMYKSERINYGQSPKQTFERKTGDCEDFSIFAVYCCSRNGYHSRVINNVWAFRAGNNLGHSVGAFRFDSKCYIIGDSSYSSISGPYESYNEIAKAIHPNAVLIEVHTWSEALSANR